MQVHPRAFGGSFRIMSVGSLPETPEVVSGPSVQPVKVAGPLGWIKIAASPLPRKGFPHLYASERRPWEGTRIWTKITCPAHLEDMAVEHAMWMVFIDEVYMHPKDFEMFISCFTPRVLAMMKVGP